MAYEHKPVLLNEVLDALSICATGFYIDATFGRGGHSEAILQRLNADGRLLAFDKDPEAQQSPSATLSDDSRFELISGSFTMMTEVLETRSKLGQVDGIMFDFGVSSPQFDDPTRGFSFRFDAPLDMRMNHTAGITVADWLNQAQEKEIADVIYRFGEERASRRIARAIVHARHLQPVTRTQQLADIITSVIVHQKGSIHPATKTFQALRIFINRELEDIEAVLPQTLAALAAGGRLAAISFNSLEDRMVKRFIRDCSRPQSLPPELPLMPSGNTKLKPVGKLIRSNDSEIERNPRSRSATLRIAERTDS